MNPLNYTYCVSYINSVKNRGITNADQLEKLEKEIIKLCPDKAAINIIFYRNDFHNLKACMKNSQKSFEDLKYLLINPCVYEPLKIYSCIAEKKEDKLPCGLREAAKKANAALNEKNYQLAEIIIDRAAMDFTLKKAKEAGSKFLTDLVTLQNTLTDIKIALRCSENNKDEIFLDAALSQKSDINRKSLIKAAALGKTELFNYLAKTKYKFDSFEEYYSKKTKQFFMNTKYTFFGIEPIISCIYQLENKIKE